MSTAFEWQVAFPEYLERLDMSLDTFEEHLHLPNTRQVKQVIPLRDIKEVHSIYPLHNGLLEKLVRGMKTLDGQHHPFEKSDFQLVQIDPSHLKSGQCFVYKEVYTSIIEDLPRMFTKNYAQPQGVNQLGAFMIFGWDAEKNYSLAYYMPPIIEQHGNELILMDGTHRSYTTKQMGVMINAILIKNVSTPFPCTPHYWKDVKVISLKDKPTDINLRYFNIQKNLFRDLKWLGIDG